MTLYGKPLIAKPGNKKLGYLIHSWSLPAGRANTCPGETHLCRSTCYAKKGFFKFQNLQTKYAYNLWFSKSEKFVPWAKRHIESHGIPVLRIHVSGDFYNEEYVDKWYEIVKQSRTTRFFAYTRSWQLTEMLPSLVRLSKLSNMQLWWSVDMLTGVPPKIEGIRNAYMAMNDIDADACDSGNDLIFRTDSRTTKKKGNNVQVCPAENGVKTKTPITCTNCSICWK